MKCRTVSISILYMILSCYRNEYNVILVYKSITVLLHYKKLTKITLVKLG